ncbi:MAG: biosis protein MshI [Pseudomonadota bacterium]|nr:biosis protein MshI [Pseudomonadota bacterium]MDQ5915729.1 biosis protein MshI [Pseudomonadota bacterium]MDQ5944692.1 biosis protein MshI [Pseudomonadota bacterium]MDQ5959155.1 biosis protein MshI [Pseudomonadota bacterium]
MFKRRREGWLAFGMFPGRIDVVHAVRGAGARPQLLRLDSYARGDDDAKALTALRKQGGLQSFGCTTLLDPAAYSVTQMEAPAVPEAELVSALRWSIKETLNYPVENATIDVIRIPSEQTSGRTPSVMAVAANNAVLGPCIQAFDQSGLDLKAVDVFEMAQRNVAALFEEEGRGLAFLHLGESGGLLTITYRGELYSVRRIEVSATQLAGADADRRSQMLERVMLELQRTLDNFDRLYGFVSVASMVVASSPEVGELQPYLAENLYLPVRALDLSTVCDFPSIPELRDPARQAQCLHVIGAALRSPEAA